MIIHYFGIVLVLLNPQIHLTGASTFTIYSELDVPFYDDPFPIQMNTSFIWDSYTSDISIAPNSVYILSFSSILNSSNHFLVTNNVFASIHIVYENNHSHTTSGIHNLVRPLKIRTVLEGENKTISIFDYLNIHSPNGSWIDESLTNSGYISRFTRRVHHYYQYDTGKLRIMEIIADVRRVKSLTSTSRMFVRDLSTVHIDMDTGLVYHSNFTRYQNSSHSEVINVIGDFRIRTLRNYNYTERLYSGEIYWINQISETDSDEAFLVFPNYIILGLSSYVAILKIFKRSNLGK